MKKRWTFAPCAVAGSRGLRLAYAASRAKTALYWETLILPCRIAASIAEKAGRRKFYAANEAMRPKRPGVAQFKLVGENTKVNIHTCT